MYFGFSAITVAYGRNTVLENLTLDVPRSKITTIIGPNGCGKSSLLKTVTRTVTPASGYVELDGRPIASHPQRLLARRIAYLSQLHTSPADTDVRTLVSYGRYPHRKNGFHLTYRDRDIIDETLELTGLTALQNRELSKLSGGERQRAWLAMAVCQQPEILILDEPTTFLDIGCQLEVLELVRTLNRSLEMTVLTVLHDLNLAARYSDLLAAVSDKHIFALGTPDEVITADNLRQLFGIEAEIMHDASNGCPYFIPLDKGK